MDEFEHGAAHKYLTVRDHLATLVAHELKVGDAIPSERDLTKQFGLSRMTVRQAVDALVTEGVLVREQGRGTFVAPQRIDFEMRLTTFGEEMRSRGMEPATTVLTAQVVAATPDVATALEVEPRDKVHYLYRVRSADGTPMCIEQVWVPVALAPALFDGGPPASMYAALRDAGLAPEWGEDTLSADEATDTEASLLGLGDKRAVLRAERRTFSVDGAAMFSRACYRADRYSIWVPLRAPRPTLVPRRRSTQADTTSPEPVTTGSDATTTPAHAPATAGASGGRP
ncbi:GntR family transcriptional regulator [Cellulomonas rhizosphaerae]|uniref:GntR family transcriptional regulator n=1 Tax=Cellulomonas rhizosphaerae TaxID=2293719 RepID=UPI001F279B2A|nr:GntR family transcriptional regulator [Cellulomonas rhizosphaerae]